ncbi:MAG: S-adenosyl-L-methionine-dependent methyltransferase [Piptocephalis tieghemiana]|nr:MAG: S-adenosyl-L-methionine-dependent methyltransferase [Piptocephalis tieghemiana]
MPRLPRPSFQTKALRRLLPPCGYDLQGARAEWRWLRQWAEASVKPSLVRPTLERALLERIRLRKPLQYILGTQPFGDLDILTRPPTLIPRWETEEWVLRLAKLLCSATTSPLDTPSLRILDLCTGTGCVSLGLAAHGPPEKMEIWGVDLVDSAVALAKDNAQKSLSLLQGNSVHFQLGDLNDPSTLPPGPFDLIVSNPPYITLEDWSGLEPEVRVWENPRALVADRAGLQCHQAIISLATLPHYLSPSKLSSLPRLVMECGEGQGEAIQATLSSMNLTHNEIWRDLAGKDRVVVAY